MSKQAISVQKAEPPLIATGHENIKDQSPLAMTWKEDVEGEVIKSDEFKGVIEIKKADGKTVKVLAWYDNEWGYTSRLIDMVKFVGER